jgi:hypothetical protein
LLKTGIGHVCLARPEHWKIDMRFG